MSNILYVCTAPRDHTADSRIQGFKFDSRFKDSNFSKILKKKVKCPLEESNRMSITEHNALVKVGSVVFVRCMIMMEKYMLYVLSLIISSKIFLSKFTFLRSDGAVKTFRRRRRRGLNFHLIPFFMKFLNLQVSNVLKQKKLKFFSNMKMML